MKKIALFVSALTLFAFWYWSPSPVSNTKIKVDSADRGKSVPITGPTERLPGGVSSVSSTVESSPVTFQSTLKDFAANQFKVEGITSNRQRVEALANSDEAVALAGKALVENEWTRHEFGEDQAAGRVLAIRVLSARARQGDLRPLRETATELGRSFQELDGGQKADLRDLVTEWIAAVGPEDFYNDPSLVLRHFRNASEVRKLVIAASVAHLGHDINNADFISRMKLWR